MNFFTYIGITKEEFEEKYLREGLVSESLHKEFPLNIYTYSRKTVYDNVWDAVTSKCRGIIVNRLTDEIVARPFEKFHNYGSDLTIEGFASILGTKPSIIEKVDGFLCTMYTWEGKHYIASKGSFYSIHAKWATAELNRQLAQAGYDSGTLWRGYTAVFEGLCRDLRIVVDYGERTGLVMLALINNETGEEYLPAQLESFAGLAGFRTPKVFDMAMNEAVTQTAVADYDDAEGYVLTWFKKGQPPFRLKLKFPEYLRLHRMVTWVSPKRIWEVLSQAHLKADLEEYLNNSTPRFSKFVTKWINALQWEYDRLRVAGLDRYAQAKKLIDYQKSIYGFDNLGQERKAWALEFMKPKNKEFASILFGILDNRDVSEIIWKRVKEMTKHGHPLVDSHNT